MFTGDSYVWEECEAAIEGCNADTCLAEVGYSCVYDGDFVTSDCMPVCGDGIILSDDSEDPEECDAGSVGDLGCSDTTCTVVMGYECNSDGPTGANPNSEDPETTSCDVLIGWDCNANNLCGVVNGDGYTVSDFEECDDGNDVDTDGCEVEGVVTPGYACQVWYDAEHNSDCTAVIGDGEVNGDEECDDGNSDSDDGCDDSGMFEGPDDRDWECDNGEPSLCGPSDWENPISDSVLNGYISSDLLSTIENWSIATSGPANVQAAGFDQPTTSSNTIRAALTIVDSVNGVAIADVRSAVELIREELQELLQIACVANAVGDGVSLDDCRFVDALSRCVIPEIYPQNNAAKRAIGDDQTDVVATFRVVSRYPSSSSALACGLAFLIAAVVALFN
jgi:cysteine-rich repeat protein